MLLQGRRTVHPALPGGQLIWMPRPPKPPSWRDFQTVSSEAQKAGLNTGPPQSGKAKRGKCTLIDFTDLSRVLQDSAAVGSATGGTEQIKSGNVLRPRTVSPSQSQHHGASHLHQSASSPYQFSPESLLLPGSGSQSLPSHSSKKHGRHRRSHSQSHRKTKHRLHRTRSQIFVGDSDLPEDTALTLSLADTKPRDLALKRQPFDPHLYLHENTKRCVRWLDGVRASEPLEDIDFDRGQGVEVEIPEESWEDPRLFRPPQNSSASCSDSEGCSEGDIESTSWDPSHLRTKPPLQGPASAARLKHCPEKPTHRARQPRGNTSTQKQASRLRFSDDVKKGASGSTPLDGGTTCEDGVVSGKVSAPEAKSDEEGSYTLIPGFVTSPKQPPTKDCCT